MIQVLIAGCTNKTGPGDERAFKIDAALPKEADAAACRSGRVDGAEDINVAVGGITEIAAAAIGGERDIQRGERIVGREDQIAGVGRDADRLGDTALRKLDGEVVEIDGAAGIEGEGAALIAGRGIAEDGAVEGDGLDRSREGQCSSRAAALCAGEVQGRT